MMISDLGILFLSPAAYTAVVVGNGGEEELSIHLSYGHNDHAAVIVTSMTIEGEGKILYPIKDEPIQVPARGVFPLLRRVIAAWTHSGDKPSPEQSTELLVATDALLYTLRCAWEGGKSPYSG